jgi:hypothetical protein
MEFTRRGLIERGGALGLVAALSQLPGFLASKGWLEDALAQTDGGVTETLSALVAFILPGDDEFSAAQGEKTDKPGGIAAGTVPVFIRNLDAFVPVAVPGFGTTTLPASGGVSFLLNRYALEVNPAGAGPFSSPFARLSFAEKAEVFKRFEADTAWDDTEFKFVSGILPGFVAFLAWSEAGVIDPETRKPKRRPVGWRLSNYDGPAEGHAELRGYYRGHRKARTRRRRAPRA